MKKLSAGGIRKLIWLISVVVFCSLVVFVCLPYYRSCGIGGLTIGLHMFSCAFEFIMVSYVLALLIVDILKLSVKVMLHEKVTGIVALLFVLTMAIPLTINWNRRPGLQEAYFAWSLRLILPLTVILISRFTTRMVRGFSVVFGMTSFFIVFSLYLLLMSELEMMGDAGVFGGLLGICLFVSLISIIVNWIDRKTSAAAMRSRRVGG
jgi:hypothetical protein